MTSGSPVRAARAVTLALFSSVVSAFSGKALMPGV